MGTKNEAYIEEFWSGVEAELGEKVLIKTLGRCHTPPPPAAQPDWGLFYLTQSFFCFRHFRSENWLSSLMKSPGERREGEPEYTIKLRRASFRRIEVIREKAWWRRLMFPSAPVVSLEYLGEKGEKEEFRFSAEKDQEALTDALRL